jgi:hypothetical protein
VRGDEGLVTNDLTGDFDAVLEVAAATLDRLGAAMHQNGYHNATLPSLPHGVYFRVGSSSGAGERGSVAAQVGTPHISLIDGATDRFWVEMGFRARYRADPGSPPLADVINGTIHAMYRIEPIDPTCRGWAGIAEDYIWLRVVRSSVTFDGTCYSEGPTLVLVPPADEDTIRAHITQHLGTLLAGQFQPRPHRIGRQFRRLVTRASAAVSAVAIPLAVNGDTPSDALSSIPGVFLDGSDFAVAVNDNVIVRSLQSILDPIVGEQTDFLITSDAGVGGGLSIDYHVKISGIAWQWLGGTPLLPVGAFRVVVDLSGWATRLYRSGVFNYGPVGLDDLAMTATAEQFLKVTFDAASEDFSVSAAGDPSVVVNYSGPFASVVKPFAHDIISGQVNASLAAVRKTGETGLDALGASNKKTALVDGLKSIDPAAGAHFDRASFYRAGIVLHGSIRLSPRHPPWTSFEKTAVGDGFDAVESWIPGGRVDSFEWSWRWFANSGQPGAPAGTRSDKDTYQLRRPHGSRSRFGLMEGVEQPLPGLDGIGKVCLYITGMQVDHVTGVWGPVRGVVECAQFGYEFKVPLEAAPYFRVHDQHGAEVGIMHAGASPDSVESANTLIVFPSENLDEVTEVLVAGVSECRRRFAGLLVLVLFPDGALNTRNADISARLGAPVLVAEDVRNRWSRYLGAPTTATAWRLMSPAGVLAWSHEGSLEPHELTAALNENLTPSRPAEPAHILSRIRIGEPLPFDLSDSECPPISFIRPDTLGSRVGFVVAGSASTATFRDLRRGEENTWEPPWAAIVVDGASKRDAQRLAEEFGHDVPFFADPDGDLTRQSGVRFTPSVLTLDSVGRVISLAPQALSDAHAPSED